MLLLVLICPVAEEFSQQRYIKQSALSVWDRNKNKVIYCLFVFHLLLIEAAPNVIKVHCFYPNDKLIFITERTSGMTENQNVLNGIQPLKN